MEGYDFGAKVATQSRFHRGSVTAQRARPSHAERHARSRQALAAALELIAQLQGELHALQGRIPGKSVIVVDSTVAPRLLALEPCLSAQFRAAEAGNEDTHSSRPWTSRDQHDLGVAAKHIFQKGMEFQGLSAARARTALRGKRKDSGDIGTHSHHNALHDAWQKRCAIPRSAAAVRSAAHEKSLLSRILRPRLMMPAWTSSLLRYSCRFSS